MMVTLSFVIILSLGACSNADEIISSSPDKNLTQSAIRSNFDAETIAINAVNSFFGQSSDSRSSENRKVKEVIAYVENTPSRSNSSDTLMYVVNFEDDGGFVIVPSSKAAEDYLVVTELGNYNPYERSDNEGFEQYMDATKDYLSQLSTQEDFIEVPIDTTDYKQVGPLHDYKWGLELPEGKYCPNNIAGCVPLAIVFAMSYCELPTTMTYQFSEKDIDFEILNWTNIKKHKKSERGCYQEKYDSHTRKCMATAENHNTLARVARQVGYLINATYYSTMTTASTHTAIQTINPMINNKIGSVHTWDDEDVTGYLDTEKILLLDGPSPETGVGHIWMCDGYRSFVTESYTCIAPSGEWVPSGNKVQHLWLHYNWGWSGYYNGYYYSGRVYPKNSIEFDGEADAEHRPEFSLTNIRFYPVSK